ncbi:MAG: glycerate dehydrogenase [Nitrospirae bacterium CG18_big_fil_WC_8_21_14_2_50_70_55]|nr:D-2-hydroxyacid dehydrogenase [Deltaproteobacteria bacterium]OIP66238.1 MAG: glycerate dehydrogenase [Nitrospirae bacterium CG2_30_70_394]PIQ03147.1 MAG: glycerate dehydrogenase [Nitrospirae bacterium CG18_big_fil_WC_8_21_14_2_50_70_55]PIU78305.1 MAG: glycerate dehydrogenase [Nitrospirae bacterium CG06_land_8_20_14_3_00_70_43]PIW82328.1 MAG: glycerate dehydrogenase [Nitrospirae bacterium CG_4_8_14_3_um_filter_70_85]PIX83748.1 MAG: glycerate dehydrogenase [Nitrospirae bacterium CG_4_10_14_3_
MERLRLCLLDAATLDRHDLDLAALEAVGALTTYPATPPAEVAERIRDAEVVITNKVVLGEREIGGAPRLKLIAVAATGVNNIDLVAARGAGVAVANVAGYSTASVVQHTVGCLLALATHLRDYDLAARTGAWVASPQFNLLDWPIWEVAGRRLGIIGYGTIGKAVARVCRALGMEVLVAASRPRVAYPVGERLPLAELLARADVLSLHCALSEQTRGLIGAAEINALPRGALLLNMARGGVADEAAVAAALRSGQLGGAAFDVLTQEPPAPDHPLLAPDLPNLLLTPHTAWASRAARQRLINEIGANVAAFLGGTRRNRVV